MEYEIKASCKELHFLNHNTIIIMKTKYDLVKNEYCSILIPYYNNMSQTDSHL